MAKQIRTIEAFIDGKCFGKVNSKKGVDNLMNQLMVEDPEAMNKIEKAYLDDFEKNKNSTCYYLIYYKKQHALKAMCSEFFERIYNSGTYNPYIFEV